MRPNRFPHPIWAAQAAGGLLLFLIAASFLPASVFTTRPGKGASLDAPSTLAAQLIYGGTFRINGQPAEMAILFGSLSVTETMRLLKASLPARQLQYRSTATAAVGKIVEDARERRFLITSLGGARDSLIFVLQGNVGAFVRDPSRIPWPASLPELDPLQSPQLVVEHTDNRFTFACVAIPGNQAESVLQNCRERLQADGWNPIPSTEAGLDRFLEGGFTVLGNRNRICWIEARPSPKTSQVIVTLVCRIL